VKQICFSTCKQTASPNLIPLANPSKQRHKGEQKHNDEFERWEMALVSEGYFTGKAFPTSLKAKRTDH
jgi:hypothetical protein